MHFICKMYEQPKTHFIIIIIIMYFLFIICFGICLLFRHFTNLINARNMELIKVKALSFFSVLLWYYR